MNKLPRYHIIICILTCSILGNLLPSYGAIDRSRKQNGGSHNYNLHIDGVVLTVACPDPSKHKTFVLCLQNILPNICEILLNMLINIDTFGLKIISIIFPIILVSLLLTHLKIH